MLKPQHSIKVTQENSPTKDEQTQKILNNILESQVKNALQTLEQTEKKLIKNKIDDYFPE